MSKINLRDSVFTIGNLHAGASDSIARLELAYDIVTSVYNIHFHLPFYENFHTPDLNFFELFGITRAYRQFEHPFDRQKQIRMSIREFLDQINQGASPFSNGNHYFIDADLYRRDLDPSSFNRNFEFARTFADPLKYTPSANPFSNSANLKVVFHLRRYDILGDILFRGVTEQDLPLESRFHVQSRPLLTVEIALRLLKQKVVNLENVDLIVVSDGTGDLAQKFSDVEIVRNRIAEVDDELSPLPDSLPKNFRLIKTNIGRTATHTRYALDAFYHSDYIVTAGSDFPLLITRIGKSKSKIIKWGGQSRSVVDELLASAARIGARLRNRYVG